MSTIGIEPLRPADRSGWQQLARGYRDFYETPTTDAEFEAAWQRLNAGGAVHGLGARIDGRLVGIAHYLMHASTWADSVCYLQDLFTDPVQRGAGVGSALIEAVAQIAKRSGCQRFYWLTQEHNATARSLYDKLARHHGFLRYDHPL
ncbi:MAG TPA: GNAT family N-acetyltransferase [Methylibium sp.]|uniref:GNAT family N-acetyltransferase n=1 Tax=Methylibium sp. TaxID=2067992 RepID=UPI002DB5B6EB|nr:GNAT family N-acetyltransferase [Methylibium sp.]HEU4458414.1 GNAT family N-acetyltransferase [Methylibium sp.]